MHACRSTLEDPTSLAPGQWELDITLSEIAGARFDNAAAIKYCEDALKVNPNAGQAYNIMAYTYAREKNWDKAIESAKKQVEVLPKEPNPVDTLAEIELWSGKFDDAEKDFIKATELDPKFVGSWQGVEVARAYKGDWKGAYEANDKFATGEAPGQKYEAMIDRAWIQFAEGKQADAMKTIDAIEKDAGAKKFPIYAYAPMDRAAILTLSGKLADAKKSIAEGKKRSEELAGDAKSNLLTTWRLMSLRIAMLEGKPLADADKLIADAVEDGKRLGDDKREAAVQAYMRGLAAWAKGGAKDGPKAAIAELEKCEHDDLICRYDLAQAKRKSGDTAGADAVVKEIKETVRRDAGAVYLLAHADGK